MIEDAKFDDLVGYEWLKPFMRVMDPKDLANKLMSDPNQNVPESAFKTYKDLHGFLALYPNRYLLMSSGTLPKSHNPQRSEDCV